MARGNAKDFDLEAIEDQLEDLDIDLDEDLLLDDDEDLSIDDSDDDEELLDDDSDEDADVTVVELEDGQEVELTESALSKLKKPQIVEVLEVLNDDGYGIDVPRTAKKDIIIKAILDADAQHIDNSEGEEDEKTPEVVAASVPEQTTPKSDSRPTGQRFTVDKERLDLVLSAIALRRQEVSLSDYSKSEKEAALAQLTHCEQLISLFLKTW